MRINQYFSKVKSLLDEILKLDPENAITETRMRRIIILGLRPEYKGIFMATRGWAKEPTLSELENLLANEEDLEKPFSRLSIKDEDKALANKRKDYQKETRRKAHVRGETRRINLKEVNNIISRKGKVGKTVFMSCHSSRQVELQDVYHVPDMKKNLLSVSQLTTSGNYVLFGPDGIKVYRNLKVTSSPIMEERSLESIYVMRAETTYMVFDEASTWWYKEVTLPNSRELEQQLQHNLEGQGSRTKPEQDVKNTNHLQKLFLQKERKRVHGKQ